MSAATRPVTGALHGSAGSAGAMRIDAFGCAVGSATGAERLCRALFDAIKPGARPRGVSFQPELSIARALGVSWTVGATGLCAVFVATGIGFGSHVDTDADAGDSARSCTGDLK
ncbi:hypothetical protein [Caballeronia sp. SEWSISQ10-4 2]|uniref:hypothetical protein n=1 Tax=Caballeronia sp. SEWSISQ10-4 2 TaxID=2937438 RepID=UPI00265A5A05|nr:hypothetical protein [Caballeronia sp. SEWSISQ10-4 2]